MIVSKKLSVLFFVAFVAQSSLYTSCTKKDDTPDEEQELITTLKIVATNSTNAADVRTFVFKDTDGAGGNEPSIDNIALAANEVYNVAIEVLDESKTPAENITAEIAEEKNDHQLFFVPSVGLNLTNTYQDADDNNLPVGLATKFTTGAVSTGILTVTLKHQPGTKNNNIATGETDVQVNFSTVIQ